MQKEIWKQIELFPGYEVSNKGRIRSFKFGAGYLLKSSDNRGYKKVILYIGKIRKTVSIHRIVAIAFIENPLNKLDVNHKDGDKENNCAENLEWSTRKENLHHAYNNNLVDKKTNTGAGKAKVIQKSLDGTFLREHDSISEAYKFLGKSLKSSQISVCCKKKRKRAYGFLWEYKKEN